MRELDKEQLETVLNEWDNKHSYDTFREGLKEKGLIKEGLEIGDYIIVEGTNVDDRYNGSLAVIENKNGSNKHSYWAVGVAGRMYNPNGMYSCGRKATCEEVETALIKEAKKRGFKEGVSCVWKEDGIYHRNMNGDLEYSIEGGYLKVGSYIIFDEGKWAKIIEEPIQELTMADVEKLAGGKVKIIK